MNAIENNGGPILNCTECPTMEYWEKMPIVQRVFTRVPFDLSIRWIAMDGDEGVAHLRNVSRGGVALSLGRYLRPGPALMLIFDDILYRGSPVELPALTVWSRGAPAAPDRFESGLALVHDHPETLGAVSEVFYAALNEQAARLAG